MHVVSASRRTDIPAYHAQWFMNRIRAGSVKVVSPFGGRLFEVSLAREDVLAIVFWTKDAALLLPHLEELRQSGYCFTFLYTVNNYPPFMEPAVPELSHTLRVLEELKKKFPRCSVRWRYDTIVLSGSLSRRWHMQNFRSLSGVMASFTGECIFSFCDYYKKTVKNMAATVPDFQRPEEALCLEMALEMAEIAADHGISFASCAHDYLVSGKISKARCIDPAVLAGVVDTPERAAAAAKLKYSPTRKECGCAESKDIGAYDTCAHGCAYCYANSDQALAKKNLSLIHWDSECLHPRWEHYRANAAIPAPASGG